MKLAERVGITVPTVRLEKVLGRGHFTSWNASTECGAIRGIGAFLLYRD